MLGVTEGLTKLPLDTSKFTEEENDNFYVGMNLIKTCMKTYSQTKTGLAPEVSPSCCFLLPFFSHFINTDDCSQCTAIDCQIS